MRQRILEEIPQFTENLIFSPCSFFEVTPLQAQRYVGHDVSKVGLIFVSDIRERPPQLDSHYQFIR